MYLYARTQYSRYTWTYNQYTHVYWVQEILECINLKEYISSIYAVKKKYSVFALSWKKYFGTQTVKKKKKKKKKKLSGFLSDENKNKILRKKKTAPPPPPRKLIKWSVPKLSEWGWAFGIFIVWWRSIILTYKYFFLETEVWGWGGEGGMLVFVEGPEQKWGGAPLQVSSLLCHIILNNSRIWRNIFWPSSLGLT